MKRVLNKIRGVFLKFSCLPKKIWKFCFWISLVVFLIGFGFSIEKIKLGPIQNLYQTIIGFWPNCRAFFEPIRWLSFATTILFGFMYIYKEPFYLLSLRSFSHDLGLVNTETLKQYRIVPVAVDVTDDISSGMHSNAVKAIDKQCQKISCKSEGANIGFYGIAHTPLLFRMGYNLGDQSNIKLFHKSRSNNSEFKEWQADSTGFRLEEPLEYNREVKSEELIVLISTTFEIKQNEIRALNPRDKHIVSFIGNNLGFDVVSNQCDAENAREVIMRNVRVLVKQYDIQRIHFLISSSAAFTVFLGMAYSSQHDPECVVYHYQRPSYPWGILIKAPANSCLIQNKE